MMTLGHLVPVTKTSETAAREIMDQHISLKLIRLALPLGDKPPLDLLLLYFDSVERQQRKIQAYLFGLCRIRFDFRENFV